MHFSAMIQQFLFIALPTHVATHVCLLTIYLQLLVTVAIVCKIITYLLVISLPLNTQYIN